MVKVRFAPSPTGHLHVGNAWTALLNYLFARNRQGHLLLRIEDTDIERSDPLFEESILNDLRWLGLSWDEGPYRQSGRVPLYRSWAYKLLEIGAAYKCFCSKEDLEGMRKASLRAGEPPRYRGTCRDLPLDVVKSHEREGKPFVVRFKAPYEPVRFIDGIHGTIDFPRGHVDDFVILKQGETPAYNFAVAVDDMLMGITHVIRGSDHVSNTPKQIMLFRAFGVEPPAYGHHPLLTGKDKKPLSKRHGATKVSEFREMGILPQALVNYLGVNGRNLKQEIMDVEELAATFSLDSLSPSDSTFDMDKLLWFNKEYMRRAPADFFLGLLALPEEYRDRVEAIRENAGTVDELKDLLKIFDGSDVEDAGVAFLSRFEGLADALPHLLGVLGDNGDETFDGMYQVLEGRLSLKRRDLFMLLRILFTGRTSGPPLKEVFPLIPKENIIERVEWLSHKFLHQ
jgi:glutamyl-tRNA synthetase